MRKDIKKEWVNVLDKIFINLILTVRNKKLIQIINTKNNDILKEINLPKNCVIISVLIIIFPLFHFNHLIYLIGGETGIICNVFVFFILIS